MSILSVISLNTLLTASAYALARLFLHLYFCRLLHSSTIALKLCTTPHAYKSSLLEWSQTVQAGTAAHYGTAVCDRHTIIFYMHDELDFLFRVSRFHSFSHSHSRFHFRFHFGNSRTRLLDNFPLNTLQFFFVSWREGKGYSQPGQRVAGNVG